MPAARCAMRERRSTGSSVRSACVALVSIMALVACSTVAPDARNVSVPHDIGAPLTEQAIAAWNIDVAPDGRGLPAGSGDVATGAHVFAAKCAACHGAQGEGGLGDPLVGG